LRLYSDHPKVHGMLTTKTVDELRNGRKRVDLHKAEKLLRGEHYSRGNIIEEVAENGYSPDRVQHLVRYHWAWLESVSEINENVQATYIDLCVGIYGNKDKPGLADQELEAVQLLIDGWATQGQFAAIAKKMGIKATAVKQILNRAFVHIAENLGYGA
jgi:hypothetical protein